ncbi:hypothetical protein [Salisediminibacterium halotolerans]|uniref:hypothetical protein n=1 Tax=Salisediminibacterium halotolerans TaxID=517425 RepID=UPI000EB5BAF7|nr:hypothetical protein [Salisediminibacterium halotolerans]
MRSSDVILFKDRMTKHCARFKQRDFSIVLESKKAAQPLPPTPPGKQETKIRIRRYETAES